jgi:hypothetical protein
MSRAGGGALLALVLAWGLGATGCNKSSVASGDAPASRLDTPSPSAPPADHLGPDELIEGTDKAFGVPLPRGLTVEQRFPDTVYATGPMTVHALTLYFRPRLQGGSLRESENVATFEHVTVAGLPAYTDLSIRLTVTLNQTRVEITSTTHPPAPDLPDVAARWKQAGLAPNGKVLDPTHLD